MASKVLFDTSGWSFAAGPEHMTHLTASVDCSEVSEYPLVAIAQSLLSFPDMTLLHPAQPSWQEWRARWQNGENALELDMNPFFADVWLHSDLHGRCTVGDTLKLWAHLRARHPGIWLCERSDDDSYLHTPQSFLETFFDETKPP